MNASLRGFLLTLLTASAMVGANAGGSDVDTVNVEVSGTGDTPEAARHDGIRQALQREVPQIIAADRRIENDNVVLDRVLSSMNGHVQAVQVFGTSKTATGYSARMLVKISKREIANFIHYRSDGGGLGFSGGALLVEASREIEARKFRATFLERFFAGYPASAVGASVDSIRPNAARPEILEVEMRFQLHPDFVARLKTAANEIRCKGDERACSPTRLCFFQQGSWRNSCITLAAGPMEGGEYPILERLKGFDQLKFALRFVDEAKRRVGQPMCFDELVQGRPVGVAGMGPAGNPIRMAESLVITDQVYDGHVFALDLNLLKESVDVARAKSLLAVATLVSWGTEQINYKDGGFSELAPVQFDITDQASVMAEYRGGTQGSSKKDVGTRFTTFPAHSLLSRAELDARFTQKSMSDRAVRAAWDAQIPISCPWSD